MKDSYRNCVYNLLTLSTFYMLKAEAAEEDNGDEDDDDEDADFDMADDDMDFDEDEF